MTKEILIIEDNKVARESLVSAFQNAGFKVISTELGSEGLTKARAEKPDIILLDLMLPDVDGYELLQKLTKNPATKNCRIVVLTNLGDQGTIAKIIKAGGRDYLVKSDYSLNEVVKKVEEIMKR